VKISQKLVIILLLIGLLPAVGISIIAYATVRTQADDTTAAQLQSTAIRQEQRINVLLREKLEEVSKLANQLNLQRTLREYFETDSPQTQSQLTDILFAKRVTFPDIQQIYLSNLEGEVVAATLADMVGEVYDEQPGMDVQHDDSDDLNKLRITIPVAIDRQEEAIVTVIFRIDDLTAAVQDYTGLGETGETMVINRSDSAAMSLFPLRSKTSGDLQSLASLNLQNHTTEMYEATSYTDEKVAVVVRPLSSADWLLAVSIDVNEAYAAPAQLRTALVWVMTGTSIIIVLIALAMTRSITVPILRIVRTSQAIGEGDLTAKSDIVRGDEIGVLSDSINKMGASLRGYVDRVREQRNRLEVILNSATESIMAIDSDGVIVMANKATTTLSGRLIGDIMTQAIGDIFVWKKGGYQAAIDYYPSEVRMYDDLEYTTSSGEKRYVKLIVSPVKTTPSQSVRAIVTVHDETKDRELENMKIDFVSMAAHELRTPLAALRGYLELAMYQKTPQAKEEATQLVGKALKSTTELSGLINNLLDVSRIERGALTFNFGKVDVAQSIKNAIDDSRIIANDKQISLKYTGPTQGYYVYADELAVHEILNNLLSNAIKYTNAGGSVTVGAKKQDDMYAVNVTDTGAGIPQRALSHLFTKFYRVHGGLDSGSTGTGLGLYITRSILDRHGGKITVESQEGVGSMFTFTLPIYASQDNVKPNETIGKTKEPRRHRGWFTKNIDR
jgi:PAS domain S-box-containing protein